MMVIPCCGGFLRLPMYFELAYDLEGVMIDFLSFHIRTDARMFLS